MTTRDVLPAGTASTAACTVAYCPLPSFATVSTVAAAGALPAVPREERGPAPPLTRAGTSAAGSSVYG